MVEGDGPRASLADKGFTFGTSTRAGICLCFDDWIESGYFRGVGMECFTVMREDAEGLARALDERGIGDDEGRAR